VAVVAEEVVVGCVEADVLLAVRKKEGERKRLNFNPNPKPKTRVESQQIIILE